MARPLNRERNAEIVACANRGESSREIAMRFGISRERVRQIVQRGGGTLKDQRRVPGRRVPPPAPQSREEQVHHLRQRLLRLEILISTVRWQLDMLTRQAS
jgi:transposase